MNEERDFTFLIGGGECGRDELRIGGILRFGDYQGVETERPMLTLDIPGLGWIGKRDLDRALDFLHDLKEAGYVVMVDHGGRLDAAFCIAVAFYAIELNVPIRDAMEAVRQILGDVQLDDEATVKLEGYIMVIGPQRRTEYGYGDTAPAS